MTSGFSMQAMTRSVPPHLGQVSVSMANTRFRRCIGVMGARGLSGFSWRGLRFSTTDSRRLQFGANTPWNRVRFNRGCGTKAVRRAMTNRQDCRFGRPQVACRVAHMHVRHQLEWVEDDVGGAVAKRLLEPIDDLSLIVGREPLAGDGGPCDVATELFELVALGGFSIPPTRPCRTGCSRKPPPDPGLQPPPEKSPFQATFASLVTTNTPLTAAEETTRGLHASPRSTIRTSQPSCFGRLFFLCTQGLGSPSFSAPFQRAATRPAGVGTRMPK